jgi:hypothetical protein
MRFSGKVPQVPGKYVVAVAAVDGDGQVGEPAFWFIGAAVSDSNALASTVGEPSRRQLSR